MNNETVYSVTPQEAKESLYQVLDCFTVDEVKYLLEKVKARQIIARYYWEHNAECGCIIGTVLHERDYLHNDPDWVAETFYEPNHLLVKSYYGGNIHLADFTPIEIYIYGVDREDDPNDVMPNVQMWIEEYLNQKYG